MLIMFFIQVPQITLPVPRLERHADTYNDEECATITIQVPVLPNHAPGSRSASRSPEVSSISSGCFPGGNSSNSCAATEPARQTMCRHPTVDSDTSSTRDVVLHNGHILLSAKESDTSYYSDVSYHGSASDSLHLSDEIALHTALTEKRSDANSDSLQFSDDFEDSVFLDPTSQETPLLLPSKSGLSSRNSSRTSSVEEHSNCNSKLAKDDARLTHGKSDSASLCAATAGVKNTRLSPLALLAGNPGEGQQVGHLQSLTDLPMVHKQMQNGTI